jgi:branched-chain amino acid transport system ATP-binding protein
MILETAGLSKSFGGLHAVADVSISVSENAIHSVIGPNGAGKTTLFNLITGALKPDGGSVRFQERDISGWTPNRLAGAGLVRTFQRTSIFRHSTVLENIELAIRSREGKNYSVALPRAEEARIYEEAQSLLTQVGLRDRSEVPAGTLAHGFQRALDIAIGLALRPKVILMDEPLAGMSRGDRHEIAELILRLRGTFGLTIVLVEHDIGMVMKLSDTISVMQYGKVIAEGPPLTIRDNAEVKKAYLHGSFAV